MIRGHFIVLEGIDGSGTTTQAVALKKKFSDSGLAAHVTAEPSNGPVGSIIRQILSGRLVLRSRDVVATPSWRTLSLLFAADRQDHIESEVEPNLRDGVNVICDRYLYSSVVYQAVSSGQEETARWIIELNRFARKPDLVLLLRVEPKEAMRRCQERDQGDDIFDEPDFQHKLAEAYDGLAPIFPETNIVVIDGNQPPEQVTAACWSLIRELRDKGSPA